MGRSVATFGTSGANNVTITGNYDASANERIFADTSSSAFTVNLPVSPAVGDTIQVIDVAGQFSINNCTIGRNSEKIQNYSEDLILNLDNASITFVYSGSTYGWVFSGL